MFYILINKLAGRLIVFPYLCIMFYVLYTLSHPAISHKYINVRGLLVAAKTNYYFYLYSRVSPPVRIKM